MTWIILWLGAHLLLSFFNFLWLGAHLLYLLILTFLGFSAFPIFPHFFLELLSDLVLILSYLVAIIFLVEISLYSTPYLPISYHDLFLLFSKAYLRRVRISNHTHHNLQSHSFASQLKLLMASTGKVLQCCTHLGSGWQLIGTRREDPCSMFVFAWARWCWNMGSTRGPPPPPKPKHMRWGFLC